MPFAAVATALHTGCRNLAAQRLDARRRASLDCHARRVRARVARRNGAGRRGARRILCPYRWPAPWVPTLSSRSISARISWAVTCTRLLEREPPPGVVGDWIRKLQDNLSPYLPAHPSNEPPLPNILDVLASSLNIMQVRIARSRMAGEPPDLIVAPRLAHLRLLDFHRAQEAIEEGYDAVERVAHALSSGLSTISMSVSEFFDHLNV